MSQSLAQIYIHIIFSTTERRPFINENIEPELFAYMGDTLKLCGGVPFLINGTADHVHILLKSQAAVSFSNLMQKVKGNSSKWLGDQAWYRGAFSWQRGYSAFSVSQSMAERVDAYIRRQEEHHRKVTFKEELIELLEKHCVTYDERYLFD